MSRYNFWDECFDEASRYIKAKSRDTDLREGYYNLMSERNWKTSAFNQLIDVISDAERELEDEYANGGKLSARDLQDAIADCVDGHFAMVCLDDRKIADSLTDRTYDQMKKAYDKFQDLCAPRRRRGDEDRGSRREREERGERGDRGRSSRGESFGESSGERRKSSGRNSGGSRDDADANAWNWLADLENVIAEQGGTQNDPEPEPTRERERPREETISRRAPDPIELIREVPRGRVEGPDFTTADPYGEFWIDGEHWMVAHRSNWSLGTAGIDDYNAIPTWHDLNEYVKYYVMDAEGNVREEFEEVTDDNRYLNQEVRVQRGEQPAERKSGGINLKALRSGAADTHLPFVETGEPARTVNLVEKLVEVADVIPTLTASKPVDSLVTATFAGRAQMLADERDVSVSLSYMRTPLAAKSWDQADLIDQLRDAPSLTAAANLMVELRPKFEESIWNKLNERYTTMVLHALKFQFQYDGVSTMNFAKHFPTVIEHIAKKRGDEFASQLADRSRYINRLACSYADAETVSDTVSDLHEAAAKFPAIVFLDFLEIITIDATLDEMGLTGILSENVAKTGLTVGPQQRKLGEALKRTYEAMQRTLGGSINARLLLSTADNFLIEITPYSNRQEAFVLSVVR